MPFFSSAAITRFQIEAEQLFVTSFPCLVDRYSFALVLGTSEYTLPDYIFNIRQITLYGLKIDAVKHREYRSYRIPTLATGRPKEYIFDNIGAQKIKLFPTPNANVAALTSNLYGSNIINGLIVEFYRTPGDSPDTLPTYIRRVLLKSYVLYKCYQMEGNGQNFKAAAYYKAKWELLNQYCQDILTDIEQGSRRVIMGHADAIYYNQMRFAGLNPSTYGIGVDEGY